MDRKGFYEQKKRGFKKLISVIGVEFFNHHKDTACFSCGETERGIFCFLGIDLHPEKRECTLSADINDWDIYASCYVTDTQIIMDKCRLPHHNKA